MKTHHKVGWSVRCGVAAMTLALGASAFAGAAKSDKRVTRTQAPRHYKVCYAFVSGTIAPQPCSRLSPIPSTASPMDIIGELPRMQVVEK